MREGEKIIPTVGVVAFEGSKVLLVKHTNRAHHVEGSVGIPAGRIDRERGEKAIDAAAREFKEETGCDVLVENLKRFPHNHYRAEIPRADGTVQMMSWEVFYATSIEGEPKESEETEPFWKAIDEITNYPLIANVEKAIKAADSYRKSRKHQ